jgi:hypothetical protein
MHYENSEIWPFGEPYPFDTFGITFGITIYMSSKIFKRRYLALNKGTTKFGSGG